MEALGMAVALGYRIKTQNISFFFFPSLTTKFTLFILTHGHTPDINILVASLSLGLFFLG